MTNQETQLRMPAKKRRHRNLALDEVLYWLFRRGVSMEQLQGLIETMRLDGAELKPDDVIRDYMEAIGK